MSASLEATTCRQAGDDCFTSESGLLLHKQGLTTKTKVSLKLVMAPTVRVSIFFCFGRKILIRLRTVITARIAVCVYKMGHVGIH